MPESFADRMRAAGLDATADLPAGARLALELRAEVERAGFACEDVYADDEGWTFFVSPEHAPVCVTLYRTVGEARPSWQVAVNYEGGLSSIWSEQGARRGTLVAARVRTLLNAHLERLRSAGGTPGVTVT